MTKNMARMDAIQIRRARVSDLDAVTRLSTALWRKEPVAGHREHAEAILSGKPASTLPLALIVADLDGSVVGFIEVGLRSHADGCDTRYPVGFVEGWYVKPHYQRRAIGRALMTAAEDWSRSQGARELASDTWIDETPSQLAHEALGFDVVDRCVHFRSPYGNEDPAPCWPGPDVVTGILIAPDPRGQGRLK